MHKYQFVLPTIIVLFLSCFFSFTVLAVPDVDEVKENVSSYFEKVPDFKVRTVHYYVGNEKDPDVVIDYRVENGIVTEKNIIDQNSNDTGISITPVFDMYRDIPDVILKEPVETDGETLYPLFFDDGMVQVTVFVNPDNWTITGGEVVMQGNPFMTISIEYDDIDGYLMPVRSQSTTVNVMAPDKDEQLAEVFYKDYEFFESDNPHAPPQRDMIFDGAEKSGIIDTYSDITRIALFNDKVIAVSDMCDIFIFLKEEKSWFAVKPTCRQNNERKYPIMPSINGIEIIDNRLWLATSTSGVQIIDLISGTVEEITKGNGLPGNNVTGMALVSGTLWVSVEYDIDSDTNGAVVGITPETAKTIIFPIMKEDLNSVDSLQYANGNLWTRVSTVTYNPEDGAIDYSDIIPMRFNTMDGSFSDLSASEYDLTDGYLGENDDSIFLLGYFGIEKINRASGESSDLAKWDEDPRSMDRGIIAGNYLYVAGSYQDRGLHAFDISTGESLLLINNSISALLADGANVLAVTSSADDEQPNTMFRMEPIEAGWKVFDKDGNIVSEILK